MSTNEVLDGIARERARLDRAVHSLGDGTTTVPITAEGWTAKDVIAHLIHWASQIAFALGAPLDPPRYVREVKGRPTGDDAWNALAVDYWRGYSFNAVKAEFDRVVDALIERVRTRTDDQMNATDAIPWAGARPLWQQIGAETFEHWPAHTKDIERVRRSR